MIHVISNSTSGIQVHPGSSLDATKLIKWGYAAITSRLTYHRTTLDAMMALEMAGDLPHPTNMERMLQVSIGGHPDDITGVNRGGILMI